MTTVENSRPGCLHDMFEKHAAATPAATAVVCGDDSLTYAGLRRRASDLASVLRGLGVRPDSVVGLHVERSIELIVAVLAVLGAGGAYLPLRVDDPLERTLFQLADSGAEVVLTSRDTDERLRDFAGSRVRADLPAPAGPGTPVSTPVTPENWAYVLYTSGTTGAPKGVTVPHRAVTRILDDGIYADFHADQTFLQACPLSFDASVFEIWGALAHGARLALLPDRKVSTEAIARAVDEFGVTSLWLTPTLFNQMVDEGLLGRPTLRQIVIGGEVLSTPHVAEAMRTTGIRLSNAYGPTEAGVFTCGTRLDDSDLEFSPPPVGRPLPGTEVRVLDRDLRPVPDGETGELCIGGDALAHGYHRRPDLTARAFVRDPSGGAGRLYRSGDLARVLPGGKIQVLGRLDDQVKIRGNRVELGEVETVLRADPDVRQAATVDQEQGSERVLVAYVIPHGARAPSVAALRSRMSDTLPDYMIPSRWYHVDRLPVNRNGKVDRAALRSTGDAVELGAGGDVVEAAGDLENVIAGIWKDVLGLASVGVDDNYFDVGGTSLSIQQVHREVCRALDESFPLTTLYEYPTIRALATAIAESEV